MHTLTHTRRTHKQTNKKSSKLHTHSHIAHVKSERLLCSAVCSIVFRFLAFSSFSLRCCLPLKMTSLPCFALFVVRCSFFFISLHFRLPLIWYIYLLILPVSNHQLIALQCEKYPRFIEFLRTALVFVKERDEKAVERSSRVDRSHLSM